MGNCGCDSPTPSVRHYPREHDPLISSQHYSATSVPASSALRSSTIPASHSKRLKSVRFNLPGSLSNQPLVPVPHPPQNSPSPAHSDDFAQFFNPQPPSSSSPHPIDTSFSSPVSSPSIASESPDMAAEGEEAKPSFPGLGERQVISARGKKAKVQSSTTSTMMLQSTLTSPDVDQLLKCLALAVYTHLESARDVEPGPSLLELKESQIFDEVANRLWTEASLTDVHFPSVESIY